MRMAHVYPFVADLLRQAHEVGLDLLSAMDAGEDPKELMRLCDEMRDPLGDALDKLKPVRGSIYEYSEIVARKSSLGQLITKGERAAAREALMSLVQYDIPGVVFGVEQVAEDHSGVDRELLKATKDLLKNEKHSDAIRGAFPVLTARLRKQKGKTVARDGQQLVNELFGQNGPFQKKLGPEKCQAVRDLLAGMYGVFRNHHSHNPTDAGAMETQAVILMLHHILTEILPPRRARKKPKKPTAPKPAPPAVTL